MSSIIEVSTLGRKGHIGSLYNIVSDTLLEKVCIWDHSVYGSEVKVQNEGSCSLHELESVELDEKVTALGMDLRLKASYLVGMVTPLGASEVLNFSDPGIESGKIKMTKYRKVTKNERLSDDFLNQANMQHESLENNLATHVVIGVEYGAEAFFIFDSRGQNDKKVSECQGKAEAISEESPKFHYFGDVCLDKNPATYDEARTMAQALPNLLGNGTDCAVPLKFWLQPLPPDVVTSIVEMKTNVNEGCVNKIANFMFAFKELDSEVEHLPENPCYLQLQQKRSILLSCQNAIKKMHLKNLDQLRALVEDVRKGNKEESTLIAYLTCNCLALQQCVHAWLKRKQEEAEVLNDVIKSIQNLEYINEDQIEKFCLEKGGYCIGLVLVDQEDEADILTTAFEKIRTKAVEAIQYVINEKMFDGDMKSLSRKRKTFTGIYRQNQKKYTYFLVEKCSSAQKNLPDNKSTSRHGDMDANCSILFEQPGEEMQMQSKDHVGSHVLQEPDDEPVSVPKSPKLYETSLIIFKEGTLAAAKYESIGLPHDLKAARVAHNSISLTWSPPKSDMLFFTHYVVQYHAIEDAKKQNIKHTDCYEIQVDKLDPGTNYAFKVQAVSTIETGLFSKDVCCISTKPTSQPGKPNLKKLSPFSVSVSWTHPDVIAKDLGIDSYVVKCQAVGESQWEEFEFVAPKQEYGNITEEVEVNPNVAYTMSVYAICSDDNRSRESDINTINITATPREIMKARTRMRSHRVNLGPPAVYCLPLKESFRSHEHKVRKCIYGKPNSAPEKVIMVVGATGSGKTTLINGLVNYVVGVEWEDDFRFKLIDEAQQGRVVNQAKSQTSWITSYSIYHQEGFNVPYTLTIIDTPGFGDTAGIIRDKEITDQIRRFFSSLGAEGIDHLDAVGFVAQSSLPRLTPTQKYIFDSILSLFGKDIAENIFMLLTFADGEKPQVLSGIKEAGMVYQRSFKFNNSGLFTNNTKVVDSDEESDEEDDNNFGPMFWEMGRKSFSKFVTCLNKVESKSLLLTKNVLYERNQLETYVLGIQTDINLGLNKLEQLKTEVQVLQAHEADIDKNKDFTYTVNEEVVHLESIPSGSYTTNCLTCKRTCHYPCGIKDDADKSGCWAMSGGSCRICPLNCVWNMHKNLPHKYDIKRESVQKTASDLKARYEEAKGKKLTAEQIITKVSDEFEAVQIKVLGLTEEIRQSLKRLSEIALKPNPLSQLDYIDILIDSEKAECHPGWQDRLEQLQAVRQKAAYMKKLADDGFDPFVEYRRKIELEEKQKKKDGWWRTAKRYFKKPQQWFN